MVAINYKLLFFFSFALSWVLALKQYLFPSHAHGCPTFLRHFPLQVVITFMNGVHRFTLDDSIGEFVYMGPVVFPSVPKTIYSCNEGNYQLWDAKIQEAVEKFKNPADGSKPYSAR